MTPQRQTEDDPTEETVFLIDDDVSVREGLATLLESVGLAVQSFGSAQEFLDAPLAASVSFIRSVTSSPFSKTLSLRKSTCT